jgi:hypothetical protein
MNEILSTALIKAGQTYSKSDPYLLFEKGSTKLISEYLGYALTELGYCLQELSLQEEETNTKYYGK